MLRDKISELTYGNFYVEQPIPDIVSLDWKTILNPPPTNLSKATIRELEFLSRETLSRSDSELKNVYYVDKYLDEPFRMLLDYYNLTYPQAYINEFYNIIRPVLHNVKSLWNRPRPFQLASLYNIDIDVVHSPTTDTASYPSGHTVYSRLVRNILADMYPRLLSRLDSIVKNTAKARVQQGVHYPSDNNASLILADTMHQHLHKKMKV